MDKRVGDVNTVDAIADSSTNRVEDDILEKRVSENLKAWLVWNELRGRIYIIAPIKVFYLHRGPRRVYILNLDR